MLASSYVRFEVVPIEQGDKALILRSFIWHEPTKPTGITLNDDAYAIG
jgi:hypothetical protein